MSKDNGEYSETPLVLVFYLDRDMMMSSPETVGAFKDNVNGVIQQKNANIISFFFPTTTEERIECINPKTIDEKERSNVNDLIDEIREHFDLHDRKIEDEDDDNKD